MSPVLSNLTFRSYFDGKWRRRRSEIKRSVCSSSRSLCSPLIQAFLRQRWRRRLWRRRKRTATSPLKPLAGAQAGDLRPHRQPALDDVPLDALTVLKGVVAGTISYMLRDQRRMEVALEHSLGHRLATRSQFEGGPEQSKCVVVTEEVPVSRPIKRASGHPHRLRYLLGEFRRPVRKNTRERSLSLGGSLATLIVLAASMPRIPHRPC